MFDLTKILLGASFFFIYFPFIRFDLNPESYSSPEMLRLVEETVTKAIVLDKQVYFILTSFIDLFRVLHFSLFILYFFQILLRFLSNVNKIFLFQGFFVLF